MKKINRNIICVLLTAFALNLFSCRNIFQPEEDVPEKKKSNSYVTIKFAPTMSRSAGAFNPGNYSAEYLWNYVLKGTIDGNEKTLLGNDDDGLTYSEFTASSIKIKPGTWNFTLTAENDLGDFSGTISREVNSDTTLEFTLTCDDGNASVQINLTWPLNETADKVDICLYNGYGLTTENEEISVDKNNISLVTVSGTTYNCLSADFANKDTGAYSIKCIFYKDVDENESDEVHNYKEITTIPFYVVNLQSGFLTNVEENIPSINEVYCVTIDASEANGITFKDAGNSGSELQNNHYYIKKGSKLGEPAAGSTSGIKVDYGSNPKRILRWVKMDYVDGEGQENDTYNFNSYVDSNICIKPVCVVPDNGLASYLSSYAVSGENVKVVCAKQIDESATVTTIDAAYFFGSGDGIFNVINSRYYDNNSFRIGLDFSLYDSGDDAGFSSFERDTSFSTDNATVSFVLPDSCTTIGDNAFKKFTKLESVTMKENVTTIGTYAFYQCNELKSITIEERVTEIGDYAFDNCRNLTSVTIPNSVTTIGVYAFQSCSGLTEITIPEQVTEIKKGVFGGCSKLASVEIKGAVTQIADFAFQGCTRLTSFKFPDSVTSILSDAFVGCTGLTEIEIPSKVTKINDTVFNQCSSLKVVKIPASVTEIGNNAFNGCSINTVYYGGSEAQWNTAVGSRNTGISSTAKFYFGFKTPDELVNVIKDAPAATGDDEPTEILIQGNITYTDLCTICNEIKSASSKKFKLDMYNAVIADKDFCDAFCNLYVEGEALITSISSLVLPYGLEEVAEGTFKGYEFDNVFISKSVNTIGANNFSNVTDYILCEASSNSNGWTFDVPVVWGAFSESSGVDASVNAALVNIQQVIKESASYTEQTSVALTISGNIKDEVITSLGNAIKGTSAATNILWVLDMSGASGAEVIGEFAFCDCTNLKTVKIPSGVTTIGQYAFCNNSSALESVELPDTITAIGYNAFDSCFNLNEFDIPASVKVIDYGAFCGCNKFKNIVIPYGVTKISGYAFAFTKFLESITIPDSVTEIGKDAFSNASCDYASTEHPLVINYGGDADDWQKISGVESAGITNYASFKYGLSINDALTKIGKLAAENKNAKIVLNEEVTAIGDYKFANKANLETVVLPNTITSIGLSAFSGCTRLFSINIPSSVETIGLSAFASTAITEIVIPEGVKQINTGTFSGCNNLKKITIPSTVVRTNSLSDPIKQNSLCNAIETVYYNGSSSQWAEFVSGVSDLTNMGLSESVKVIYPMSADDAANAISNATEAFKVTPDSSVTDLTSIATAIKNSALSGWELDMKGLNMTSISEGLFQDCANLSSVTLPDSVTSLGKNAFYGCSGLTSIDISSVTSIDEYAFYNCSGLTSVTIPDDVTSLGLGVFYGCSALSSVNIPAGVTSIGGSAFKSCTSLSEIIIPNSVQSIGENAFDGCTGLTSVTIPGNVKSIGKKAFFQCSNLGALEIKSGVESIGEYAFYQCKLSDSLKIPNTVTSIGSSAFYGCKGLTSVTISDAIELIDTYVFYGCDILTSVIIPADVTEIKANAFTLIDQSCPLTDIFFKGTEEQWAVITKDGSGITDSINIVYNYSD